MMPPKRSVLLVVLIAAAAASPASTQSPVQQSHRCATEEHHANLLARVPGYGAARAAIEAHGAAFALSGAGADQVIRIPVVVHVVYRTASQNISQAQIDSQIAVLNEDFRRQNADAVNTPAAFLSVAADAEIEFALATIDPAGAPTSGVTRTATTVNAFSVGSDNVKFTALGGKDGWPSAHYFNIWVAPLQSGVLGYAQFPGGPSATDGVVIRPTSFGRTGTAASPFDLGRTTTHEAGHWLNLLHIWGDGPCGVDDLVADTPASDAPNYGCAAGHVSCGSVDMVQNYMDYSDDACMNLFTAGQKQRIRALFAPGGFRESLHNSPGLGAPPYQANQPLAGLSAGGVQTAGTQPAAISMSAGQTVSVAVESTAAGAPYEGAYALSPAVPAGPLGLVTPGGQVVNLPMLHPTFAFLFGGGPVPHLLPFPGSHIVPLSPSVPLTFAVQMLVLTPAHADGFALSQAVQFDVGPAGQAVAFPSGPATDDGVVTVPLTGPAYNLSIPFFGQTYNQLHVSANGRVTFGAPNAGYEPTLTSAVSGQPFAGFWTDLNPYQGGAISILNPAPGIVRVEYSNVPYYNHPATGVSFAIAFDTATARVRLEGLAGIPSNPAGASNYGGYSQILGLSAGGPGSVYSGPTLFAPGMGGGPPSPGAILVDWHSSTFASGLVQSLLGSLDAVEFIPQGASYFWAGY